MEEIKFYRCMLCGKVIGPWEIVSGEGCRKCGGKRMMPANLNLREKVVQLIRHPRFWRWKNA